LKKKAAINKGFAGREGSCTLRQQFVIILRLCASTAGLLLIIFYFYIFIKQRFRADTAMNPIAIGSLPAAIPERGVILQYSLYGKRLFDISSFNSDESFVFMHKYE